METLDLYDILDFILNNATTSELDAVRAALRRRETDLPDEANPRGTGALGTNIRDMAQTTAENIQGQVGVSQDGIRDMVHRTVREIIVREAPELEAAQVDDLLSNLVTGGPGTSDEPSTTSPDKRSTDASKSDNSGGNRTRPQDVQDTGSTGSKTGLPKDALISMIGQFVTYSTGAMSVREEMGLTEQMGKWQLRYWERFPQVVRRLVSLFIKGAMSGTDFWRGIDDALDNPDD